MFAYVPQSSLNISLNLFPTLTSSNGTLERFFLLFCLLGLHWKDVLKKPQGQNGQDTDCRSKDERKFLDTEGDASLNTRGWKKRLQCVLWQIGHKITHALDEFAKLWCVMKVDLLQSKPGFFPIKRMAFWRGTQWDHLHKSQTLGEYREGTDVEGRRGL